MGFSRRIYNLLRRRHLHSDLDRELSFHLAEKIDELVASGFSEEEARQTAKRQFGNYTIHKERTLDMDVPNWIASVGQDLQYGVRMIRKSPAFTCVVLLSLSIGIGANAALFSLVDALLLRQLPVKNPAELVYFQWTARPNWLATSISGTTNYDPATTETRSTSLSFEMFRRFREQSRTLADVFAFAPMYQVTVSANGHPDLIFGQFVSGNYFSALGVDSAVGRVLSDDDDRQSNPVAVISYQYWVRHFERSPNVVGQPIVLNGIPLTIVGVTAQGFLGTQGLGGESAATDISIPLQLERQLPTFRRGPGITTSGTWWLRIMGRRRPGISEDAVRAEMEPLFLSAARDGWEAAPPQARREPQPNAPAPILKVASGRGGLKDEVDRPFLLIVPLAAISGIILFIVCVNLANLMLARSAARQSELTVRQAIGGGRLRLIRQLLTESILQSLIAGALSLLVAYWGIHLLVAMLPNAGMSFDLRIDTPVLVFTFVVSIVSGLFMAMSPALKITAENLNPALKESSRTVMGRQNRLSQGLLVAQVAVSIVLLAGAAMFAKTVWNLRSVDVGFDPNHILMFRVTPRALKYSDSRIATFYSSTLERIGAIPGVNAVTLSNYPVVGTSGSSDTLDVDGDLSAVPADRRDVHILLVHPNFFHVLGTPVIAGRNFSAVDAEAAPKVALINEALAHRLFLNRNPIGTRVGFGGPTHRADIEIVGVVRDISLRPSREPAPPAIFLPDSQGTPGTATFLVRTAGNPEEWASAVREATRQVDSNLPLFDVKTLNEQIESGFLIERIFATATAFFGVIALLLACIGIFGLVSYRVERRTNEIGLRLALGATRLDVVRLVMQQTFALLLTGTLFGCFGWYGAGKLLATLPLFRVSPADPLVLAVASALLGIVASIAAYLPARIAARIDPTVALRCE